MMAVYQVVKGELDKVGETLEGLLRADLTEWDDWEEDVMSKGLQFHRYDEEEGVYRLYRREDVQRPAGELPGIRYVFDVNIDDSNIDYILVEDSLPQFLAVMKLLEPLAARKARLDAEFEKQAPGRR